MWLVGDFLCTRHLQIRAASDPCSHFASDFCVFCLPLSMLYLAQGSCLGNTCIWMVVVVSSSIKYMCVLAVPCWLALPSLLLISLVYLAAGLSSVSLSSSMQGAMARVRGPFTPSQWIELEHQALIYKYLAANSPVPHSLLIPIRRSLTSPYSPAYFGSSTCKPRNGKGSRSTECFLGFSSFHHGLIFMIKAVPFPDLGCIALGWVFALQWDGGLSSWATPAARIRSPAGAAGRTARNGGARGMRSPTRSTVSDT